MDNPSGSPPIAVVGLSALFPDSVGSGAFWRNVAGGRDSIGEVPPGYWLTEDFYSPEIKASLKLYTTRGGFLPGVAFDPAAFGLSVASLKSTDSIQFLALQVAKRLLDDTRSVGGGLVDPARIGVVLGMAATTELVCEMSAKMQRPVWRKVMREQGLPEDLVERVCKGIENEYVPWTTSTFPGLLNNVVAGRITNRFGLGGINCVVDAACASSLAALDLAVKSLASGDSDLVIAGGADALNAEFIFMCFCRTLVVSPTGDCRPFSRDADGTLLGEGLGMLALRRLEDAERDGDTVYAVIRGVGAASDGHGKNVYTTTVAGQALALGRAYQRAGVSPDTVELLEAHGTGTRAGDAVEMAALAQVFAGPEPCSN
jgi:acyl transferase domain-containing protein